MLADEPVILSGKPETYSDGKDTGRYWVAGASNVHWLIVTDRQLGKGINQILQRVKSPGVLIEGNSFAKFVRPDYFVMVKLRDSEKIKTTARQSMSLVDAVYIADSNRENVADNNDDQGKYSKVYLRDSFSALVEDLRCRFQERASQS
jgi:hypothetical protein